METTKNKAIEAAKKELRNLLGVKRLSYVSIKGSSTQCECGETYAVEVTGKSGGKIDTVIVGVCAKCGIE